MWRMGFVIIHDKITLYSASRGGQEPSRKHYVYIYIFLMGSNPQYPENFLQSHKHWGHVYAERQHKAAKTQSSKSSWYGAVLCHTVLVVWVHSHGFSTELGRTSQLPTPVWHHLGWIWEGISKPEAAVAEQTLPSLSAQASQPLTTTFVFMQSEENVHLLCSSWCYSFYCDNIRRSKGNLYLNHRECDSQRMKDLIPSKSLSLRTVAIQAGVMFVDLGSSCSY